MLGVTFWLPAAPPGTHTIPRLLRCFIRCTTFPCGHHFRYLLTPLKSIMDVAPYPGAYSPQHLAPNCPSEASSSQPTHSPSLSAQRQPASLCLAAMPSQASSLRPQLPAACRAPPPPARQTPTQSSEFRSRVTSSEKSCPSPAGGRACFLPWALSVLRSRLSAHLPVTTSTLWLLSQGLCPVHFSLPWLAQRNPFIGCHCR